MFLPPPVLYISASLVPSSLTGSGGNQEGVRPVALAIAASNVQHHANWLEWHGNCLPQRDLVCCRQTKGGSRGSDRPLQPPSAPFSPLQPPSAPFSPLQPSPDLAGGRGPRRGFWLVALAVAASHVFVCRNGWKKQMSGAIAPFSHLGKPQKILNLCEVCARYVRAFWLFGPFWERMCGVCARYVRGMCDSPFAARV